MKLKNPNNLLIIRLSSLGDILLTTPLIRAIKRQYPGVKIDFLIKEQYSGLIKYNPHISNIFAYTEGNELIQKLKERNYDLIIDLQNNLRSFIIHRKINVKRTRFNKRTFDRFLLVKFKINNLKDVPPLPVRYAETLENITLDNEGLDLFIPGSIKSTISFNEKNIGFAPGSRHFTKMWPAEYYIALGGKLAKLGYKIILFGGQSDTQICREISSGIPGAIDLSNNNNILQTAADMKNCSAIVCNDSGLMHTACAVKVPVFVFFGSTVREFGFTPYQNQHYIMENAGLPCRPCTHIGRDKCPLGHFKCMLELTPDSALDKLLLMMKA